MPANSFPLTARPCHTTGYIPEGNQDALPGLIGTWVEDGVGCENCHGPGSNHVNSPYLVAMPVDRAGAACGDCHSRTAVNAIEAHDGFIDHNQQYAELFASKKRVMDCVDCHNPHASTLYDAAQAIKSECATCHFESDNYQKINDRRHATCVDCHMPRITTQRRRRPGALQRRRAHPSLRRQHAGAVAVQPGWHAGRAIRRSGVLVQGVPQRSRPGACAGR
jgi:formate-dependent nitrite reductase cytochrome c552 subunit